MDQAATSHWIDLPHGVRVQVRAPDRALIAAANAAAVRQVRHMQGEAAVHRAAGASDRLPDLANPDTLHGVCAAEFIVGLARFGIIAWEGVAGADGRALALTPEGARCLAYSPLGIAFLESYQKLTEAPVIMPADNDAFSAGRHAATPSGRCTAQRQGDTSNEA